jgi:hypothetical protein
MVAKNLAYIGQFARLLSMLAGKFSEKSQIKKLTAQVA